MQSVPRAACRLFGCDVIKGMFVTLWRWLLVVSLQTAVGVLGNNAYCDLCKDHTLCQLPDPDKLGEKCQEYEPHPLTSVDKQAILASHNKLRSKLAMGRELRGKPGPQPSAGNMYQLNWDDELAAIAQRWANQCKIEDHDTCRDTTRFRVGQNMAAAGDTGTRFYSDLPDLIQRWYDEVVAHSSEHNDKFVMKTETGHYTQMVWGSVYLVGCGRAVFKQPYDIHKMTYEFLVCNYGPGGNIIGGYQIYMRAPPASNCSVVSQQYEGLCIRVEPQPTKATTKPVLVWKPANAVSVMPSLWKPATPQAAPTTTNLPPLWKPVTPAPINEKPTTKAPYQWGSPRPASEPPKPASGILKPVNLPQVSEKPIVKPPVQWLTVVQQPTTTVKPTAKPPVMVSSPPTAVPSKPSPVVFSMQSTPAPSQPPIIGANTGIRMPVHWLPVGQQPAITLKPTTKPPVIVSSPSTPVPTKPPITVSPPSSSVPSKPSLTGTIPEMAVLKAPLTWISLSPAASAKPTAASVLLISEKDNSQKMFYNLDNKLIQNMIQQT